MVFLLFLLLLLTWALGQDDYGSLLCKRSRRRGKTMSLGCEKDLYPPPSQTSAHEAELAGLPLEG